MEEPKRFSRPFSFDKWKFTVDEYAESGIVNVNSIEQEVHKGWIPHGGIALKDVYHDGYRLGHDIRGVCIWVFPGSIPKTNGLKPKQLMLGAPDFVQVDLLDNELNESYDMNRLYSNETPFTSLPLGFSVYQGNLVGELKVKWRSKFPLFGIKSGYLWVTQSYLFTDYSTSPAHEPTGNSMMARLHPIIHIHYEHLDFVEKIRVDYRFHFALDHYTKLVEVGGGWTGHLEPKTVMGTNYNQAGLFKDESQPIPIGDGVKVQDLVFASVEKPLLYEVVTSGLNPTLGEKVWDNIHWWGSNLDSSLPTTPGAANALHMHWRWGDSLALKSLKTYPQPAHEDEQQFTSESVRHSLTEPQVDLQLQKIGVVLSEKSLEHFGDQSTENFFDYFKNKSKLPTEISGGGDICAFYSVEIEFANPSSLMLKRKSIAFNLCIHGMYFGHNEDYENFWTGAYAKEGYENPAKKEIKQQWERYPK